MKGNEMKPYSEVEIWSIADDMVFESMAARIERDFKGRVVERIDAPGTRYWDFEVQGELITLHLMDFIGITVFPKAQEKASPKANLLVEMIGGGLKGMFFG